MRGAPPGTRTGEGACFTASHPVVNCVGLSPVFTSIRRSGGVRLLDILKGLNQVEGFGPEADRAPEIWFETMVREKGEPLGLRDYLGHSAFGRNDVERFVRDYYDERGWKEGLVERKLT